MLLIRADFPEAKFLTIVRNPLNVVAGLMQRPSTGEMDIETACAHWCEAVQIAHQYRLAFPDEIHWIEYEDLVNKPSVTVERILEYLNLPALSPEVYADIEIRHDRNIYQNILEPDQIKKVQALCVPVIEQCALRNYFEPDLRKGTNVHIGPRDVKIPKFSSDVDAFSVELRPHEWPLIEDACRYIAETFNVVSTLESVTDADAGGIPRVVFQYWDRKPLPNQIRQLIQHNRKICKKYRIKYILFDEDMGGSLFKEIFSGFILRDMENAPASSNTGGFASFVLPLSRRWLLSRWG